MIGAATWLLRFNPDSSVLGECPGKIHVHVRHNLGLLSGVREFQRDSFF
jgi:hypothetical protein